MPNVALDGLSRHEVKERMGYGGVTEIARRTSTTPGHVSQVLSGKRADRRVAVAVARMIRVRLEELPTEMYAQSSQASPANA